MNRAELAHAIHSAAHLEGEFHGRVVRDILGALPHRVPEVYCMRVGADIESTCRKCGDVWHVVIAMTGSQIAKVECKDCGARHGYRPTGGKAARKSGAIRRTAKAKNAKPIVEANLTRPRRSFEMTETYEIGDRVIHPTFGEGVVQARIGATKVEVLFETGPKTMVHGRRAS